MQKMFTSAILTHWKYAKSIYLILIMAGLSLGVSAQCVTSIATYSDPGTNASATTENNTSGGKQTYTLGNTNGGIYTVAVGPNSNGCTGAYTIGPVSGPSFTAGATVTFTGTGTNAVINILNNGGCNWCSGNTSAALTYKCSPPTDLTAPTTTSTTTQTTTGSIGNGQWDIYCYNAGDAAGGSGSWTTNYSGHYTVAALGFNTTTASPSWANGASISTASNYYGCYVPTTNMSWSCLRTNVACGVYTVQCDQDDDGQFYINGTNYYSNTSCCTSPNTVGTFVIAPSDILCWRVSQGGGGDYGEIIFTAVTPATLSAGSIGTSEGICTGGTPAALTETGAVSGGAGTGYTNGTYTYSWQYQDNCTGAWTTISGATSNTYTFTGAIPNTRCYHRIVTDRCGNTATSNTVTVTLVATASGGSISTVNYCSGAGSATVSIAGASNATQYAWSLPSGLTGSSSSSSITVSGSTAGSYTVTATPQDAAAGVTCSGSAVTGTVNIIKTPSGGSISTVSYCSTTGSATISVAGVSNATQYAWSLPTGLSGSSTASTITVSSTTAGSYTVTVTPQDVSSGITCNGSAVTGTVNVVATPSGGSIATVTYCSGSGSATVSVSGVSNATQYAWSLPTGLTGSSTTSSITVSGTSPGSYTVTVTPQDVSSGITCSETAITGTVTIVTTPSGGSIAGISYCSSVGMGTISAGTVSSATQYVWSVPSGLSLSSSSTVLTTTTLSSSTTVYGSTANTYTVTVTPQDVASGITCSETSYTGTVIVNQTPTPTFSTVPPTPTCTYVNATYTTQSGETNYVWTGFGTAGVDYNIVSGGISSTDYTVTLQWLSTGTKTITISYTSGTCMATSPASTNTVVNASPTPTISTSGLSCTGSTIHYTTQSGETGYMWSIPGTPGTDYTIVSGSTSTSAVAVSWLTSGSKTVTVNYTSSSGCTGPVAGSNTQTIAAGPTAASIAETIDPCNGGYASTITITGGSSPFLFELTPPGSYYTIYAPDTEMDARGATSVALSNISDANGCPPGSISGSPITLGSRALTTGDSADCVVTAGATKIFYDHSGNLMASVTSGSAMGNTAVTTTIDGSVQQTPTSPSAGYPDYGTHAQSYLQRHFMITPATSAAANVCLYVTDGEVSNLSTASASDDHSAPAYYQTFSTSLTNANVTEYDGGSGSGTPQTPGNHSTATVITNITASHNPTVDGFTYSGVWQLCFNVGGFSGFYIHAANVNSDPLPVTLVSFTAEAVSNEYIRLNWITASEINNSGFDIERSVDGKSYESIGWIAGHGNSTVTNEYQYSDLTATPGIVYYYRLKQIDMDGNFAYSNIASAELTGDKGFVLEGLYPNPANSQVSIGVISNIATIATVIMTDMLGRSVIQDEWSLSVGYNTNVFDLTNMASGTYIVTITSGTVRTSKHLVITK
jgi:hypothetical protein